MTVRGTGEEHRRMQHVVDGPGGTRYVVKAEPVRPDGGPSVDGADGASGGSRRGRGATVPGANGMADIVLLGTGAAPDGPWRVHVSGPAESSVFTCASGEVA